ncbi:MAG: GAF domain-containing protein [Xenococcaceae cyanobacterium]
MMMVEQNNLGEKSFEQLFEAAAKREEAISKHFKREEILQDICQQIKSQLNSDLVTIQLIRPEEKIIETVAGAESKWVGRARHYLEKDPELREIQADIAQTCLTEIIAGWDKRFDEWIYEEFHHKSLTHIFTPIVLIRDKEGTLNRNWFENFDCRVPQNEINNDWFMYQKLHDHINGQHTIIEIHLPNLDSKKDGTIIEVIGTVEVGYWYPKQPIEVKKAEELIKFVASKAVEEIFPALPHSMLQEIAESTKEIVEADSSSLHFLKELIHEPYIHEVKQGKIVQRFLEAEQHLLPYVYEVFSGEIGWRFLKDCRPRKNGLGQQAIHENKYKTIPDSSQNHDKEELKHFNPCVFEAGIRAMAAFPLLVDQKQGVIYVDFVNEHAFTKQELHWLKILTDWSSDAIRHTLTYEKVYDRANQLMTLHAVVHSLTQIGDKEKLLHYLAWNTLNILAADVVTIYEYIYTDTPEKAFPNPPTTAGKLKVKKQGDTKLNEKDIPFLLIEKGYSLYASQIDKDPIFQKSTFAKCEGIESVGGILLKIGQSTQEQVVGVMLIGYRRPHHFSYEEEQLIEILSSSAAIAIMNQRWLEASSDIYRGTIASIDKKLLLDLIIHSAVQMTGADLADIRLLEAINQELIMEVCYPEQLEDSLIRMKLGEGITGWVAEHRESLLVNANTDARYSYKQIYVQSGSELCVPLLAGDRLLGVLNVESKNSGAFTPNHQRMLENLAAQAVIAIQNIENKHKLIATKQKLIANEQMAALGHWVGPLIQMMKSKLGAIQVWAQKVLNRGDDYCQGAANEIQTLANELMGKAEHLQGWVHEKRELVDINQVICHALAEVPLPPNVTLKLNVEPNLPRIEGGKDPLALVFHNLIQNAKDAMKDKGGTLTVDCSRIKQSDGCWVVVKVRDTGVGIPLANRPKIFEPGFSTKPTQARGEIGLWWTKIYLQSLEGNLDFESIFDEGTTFRVVLPEANRNLATEEII